MLERKGLVRNSEQLVLALQDIKILDFSSLALSHSRECIQFLHAF
jgi:hypothetical protein